MQVPLPDKTGLQARKRFVDGGGAEDGNGTIYRSVAYRTEGLFKFSGDFFSTFYLVQSGGSCSKRVVRVEKRELLDAYGVSTDMVNRSPPRVPCQCLGYRMWR